MAFRIDDSLSVVRLSLARTCRTTSGDLCLQTVREQSDRKIPVSNNRPATGEVGQIIEVSEPNLPRDNEFIASSFLLRPLIAAFPRFFGVMFLCHKCLVSGVKSAEPAFVSKDSSNHQPIICCRAKHAAANP